MGRLRSYRRSMIMFILLICLIVWVFSGPNVADIYPYYLEDDVLYPDADDNLKVNFSQVEGSDAEHQAEEYLGHGVQEAVKAQIDGLEHQNRDLNFK